jgi:hypothetical protein
VQDVFWPANKYIQPFRNKALIQVGGASLDFRYYGRNVVVFVGLCTWPLFRRVANLVGLVPFITRSAVSSQLFHRVNHGSTFWVRSVCCSFYLIGRIRMDIDNQSLPGT